MNPSPYPKLHFWEWENAVGRTRLGERMQKATNKVLCHGWNCGKAGKLLKPPAVKQQVRAAVVRVLAHHYAIQRENALSVKLAKAAEQLRKEQGR